MRKILRNVFVVTVSFGLTIATGCAGDVEKISRSGFLTSYPEFIRPGPKGGADWIYIKHDFDSRSYNKLMIDPLEFHFSEDIRYTAIHPNDLKMFSETFHRVVENTLEDTYTLVDKSGPDVLRLRFAVTELFPKPPDLKQIPSLPDLDKMTTVTSSGMAIRMSGDLASGFTYFGEATMEAELLDSQTNEQLVVAIDKKKTETQKEIIAKWEHAEEAFKFWVKHLRHFWDKDRDKNGLPE